MLEICPTHESSNRHGHCLRPDKICSWYYMRPDCKWNQYGPKVVTCFINFRVSIFVKENGSVWCDPLTPWPLYPFVPRRCKDRARHRCDLFVCSDSAPLWLADSDPLLRSRQYSCYRFISKLLQAISDIVHFSYLLWFRKELKITGNVLLSELFLCRLDLKPCYLYSAMDLII